jgi:hypothetical protein
MRRLPFGGSKDSGELLTPRAEKAQPRVSNMVHRARWPGGVLDRPSSPLRAPKDET